MKPSTPSNLILCATLFTAALLGPAASSMQRLAASAVEATCGDAEKHHVDGRDFDAARHWRQALELWAQLPAQERAGSLAEAELALRRLDQVWGDQGNGPDSIAIFATLAGLDSPGGAAGAAEREITSYARYLHGWALLDMGAPVAAAGAAWKDLGFLQNWQVIGPFDNERGSQFLTELGPEKGLELGAPYLEARHDGKKRPVAWRRLPRALLAGTVDFSALFVPNEQCLAYAMTHVEAGAAVDAALRLGSDEGLRVWVNGQLVASNDTHRSFDIDQDIVGVRLQKGWNSILVKVTQTTDDWYLAARLTDANGAPLAGVAEKEPPPDAVLTRLEGDAAKVPVATGLIATLEQELQERASDARGHYLLGAILQARNAFDENEHPDTELLKRAVQIDKDQAAFHLTLATSQKRSSTIAAQKDDNAWRLAMEQAARLGSARADVELARHTFDTFSSLERARLLVRHALERSPELESALLLDGDLDRALQLPRARERAHDRAYLRADKSLRLLLAQVDRLEGEGKINAALELLAQASKRGGNFEAATIFYDLARLCLAVNKSQDALAALATWRSLQPLNTTPDAVEAEILEGLGRGEEAVASLERALEICPEDHKLLARQAQLLLRLARKSEGLAALERSLDLQPNQPELREYVEFLKAERSLFEENFRRDTTDLVRQAIESRGSDAGNDPARVLLDLTAIQVNKDGTTKTFVQNVLQVLNERGIRMYDQFGSHYAHGEQVLEFKKAKVTRPDGSSAEAKLSRHGGAANDPSGNYYSGSVDLPSLSIGDVIEIEYVREDIAQSFFGDYFGHIEVFQDPVAVQEKVFILRVPRERKFYFHQRNMQTEPVTTDDEATATRTYVWTRRDIPRLDPEPSMPQAREVSPVLEVSTFETWDAFNKWYWSLIRKQFETSPEIAKKVRELTSGLESDTEKIRAIYNFVVTDVRYNAWEFGVHGFKPYNAATVFARRFGDCKDKAMLLSVMLKEVGLTALPVLIRADEQRGKEDLTLPMVNHFNHCIAYVPAGPGREELFLDGTAQHHGFRDVPSMDRGASVVVVGEDRALLETVPWNRPDELAVVEETTVTLKADLAADLQVRAQAAGDYAVYIRNHFEIAAERKTLLEKTYGKRFAASTVQAESFSNLLNIDEPVSFQVGLTVPRFIDEAPEGLSIRAAEDFFQSARSFSGMGSLEKRDHDVLLGPPRSSRLKTVYLLPPGLRVKSLPAGQEIQSRFGKLLVKYAQESPDRLVVERVVEVTSHRVAISDYAEFREFAAAVGRLEDEKIVLERA